MLFKLKYESGDSIFFAIPWVFDVTPSIISPTTKFSFDEILKMPVLGSHPFTIPVAESDLTDSSVKYWLFFNNTLKVGKCFWGIILPTELISSNDPGVLLVPSKNSDIL